MKRSDWIELDKAFDAIAKGPTATEDYQIRMRGTGMAWLDDIAEKVVYDPTIVYRASQKNGEKICGQCGCDISKNHWYSWFLDDVMICASCRQVEDSMRTRFRRMGWAKGLEDLGYVPKINPLYHRENDTENLSDAWLYYGD
jgi:hypothetical protein